MELLEGETLREALAAGPLSHRRAVDYAIQIARGLAAAHDKAIVHRDLKPENLFVTNDGRVKILRLAAPPDATGVAWRDDTRAADSRAVRGVVRCGDGGRTNG
jgi:hypothetical protein